MTVAGSQRPRGERRDERYNPTDAQRDHRSAEGAYRTAPLTPPAQALYDPAKEYDSCGVGFVADMKNCESHDILEKGLRILVNLDHRGAVARIPRSATVAAS